MTIEHYTADRLYHFKADGDDSSGDGSIQNPFKTPSHIYQMALRGHHLGGHTLFMKMIGNYRADVEGVAAGPWTMRGIIAGAETPENIQIYGADGVDGVNSIAKGQNNYPIIDAFHNAMFTVRGMNLWPGAGGKAVNLGLAEGVIRDIWTTQNGGNCLFSVADGRMTTKGNIVLSSGGGPLSNVCVAEDRSVFYLGGHWTMNGSPSWVGCFINGDIGGTFDLTDLSYSGAHSGGKRRLTPSAILHMNGLSDQVIPGSGDIIQGVVE